MALFARRIDGHPGPRLAQRGLRVRQSRHQPRQHRYLQAAQGLALGHAPFVVAVAVRQIQALQQLAAKAGRRLFQRRRRGLLDAADER